MGSTSDDGWQRKEGHPEVKHAQSPPSSGVNLADPGRGRICTPSSKQSSERKELQDSCLSPVADCFFPRELQPPLRPSTQKTGRDWVDPEMLLAESKWHSVLAASKGAFAFLRAGQAGGIDLKSDLIGSEVLLLPVDAMISSAEEIVKLRDCLLAALEVKQDHELSGLTHVEYRFRDGEAARIFRHIIQHSTSGISNQETAAPSRLSDLHRCQTQPAAEGASIDFNTVTLSPQNQISQFSLKYSLTPIKMSTGTSHIAPCRSPGCTLPCLIKQDRLLTESHILVEIATHWAEEVHLFFKQTAHGSVPYVRLSWAREGSSGGMVQVNTHEFCPSQPCLPQARRHLLSVPKANRFDFETQYSGMLHHASRVEVIDSVPTTPMRSVIRHGHCSPHQPNTNLPDRLSCLAGTQPKNIIRPGSASCLPNMTMNLVDIEKIRRGLDVRTTIMLRNIPNRVDQPMLKQFLDATSHGQYDFLYLRIDFTNSSNVGYGFVNFTDPESIINFAERRVGRLWDLFGSSKKIEVSYAAVQGQDCLIQKFRNSSVMLEHPSFRPLIFHPKSSGLCGQPRPFPEPDNESKMRRSIANAGEIGLYSPRFSQDVIKERNRARRSQFDRGTRMAFLEEKRNAQMYTLSPSLTPSPTHSMQSSLDSLGSPITPTRLVAHFTSISNLNLKPPMISPGGSSTSGYRNATSDAQLNSWLPSRAEMQSALVPNRCSKITSDTSGETRRWKPVLDPFA